MKILMLTWEYPPRIVGGIARVVHDLSKRLIKDGHEVTVITYKEGDLPEYENDKGVEVYRVENYMIHPNSFIDWTLQLNFNMVAKAAELINKNGKFDVIHAHDWLVASSAKTLKQSYGIPLVATIHATESGRNSGIHNDSQRYINDTEWLLTYEATEVIVNSNFMKGHVQSLFGLPFDKINVVPNGINLTNFNGIERDYEFRRQYAMDNEKIILYVGRLVYEKGIQHLISAMPKIIQGYNDVKLVIAGKGGDGCTSFRREKFVEMGGPNGGNGGKGASIIFKTDPGLRTLIDLHMMKQIKGDKGTNGKGSNRNGANTEDVYISVPMGTTIYDDENNIVLADLTKENEEYVVARGGRGGRGNRAWKR